MLDVVIHRNIDGESVPTLRASENEILELSVYAPYGMPLELTGSYYDSNDNYMGELLAYSEPRGFESGKI